MAAKLLAPSVAVLGASWSIANAGAAADPLAEVYGVSLAAIGLLTTALFVVQAVTQFPAGRAIDRFGPRPVVVAGLMCVLAGNLLLLAAPSFVLALAGRGVCGVGVGLVFLGGVRFVQVAGGGVAAQGVYGGLGLAGGGLALAIVPLLDDPLGWRAPWWTAAAASLPGLAALAFVRVRHVGGGGASPDLRGLLADARLRVLLVVHVASFGFAVVLAAWAVPLLERAGQSRAFAGVVGGMVLLLGIVSRPIGGVLARRRGGARRGELGATLALAAAGAALLAAAPSVAPLAVLGAVLAGIAAGLPFGPVLDESAAARPDAPGAAVGAVNTCAVVTIVTLTPLLGLTFDLPGEGRLGVAALAALCAAAALSVRGSRRRPDTSHR